MNKLILALLSVLLPISTGFSQHTAPSVTIGTDQTITGQKTFSVPVINTGVAAATAPTIAAGSAGNVSGTYKYVTTFVTAYGETGQANPSATGTFVSKRVNLTDVAIGGTGVTSRNIYRLNVAATTDQFYKMIGSIADNTTTIFEDNVVSGSNRLPGSVNSTAFLKTRGININTGTAVATMQVTVEGEGHNITTASLNNPHYPAIFDSEDCLIMLASSNEGGHGSGIELGDYASGTGTFNNKWGIIRRSSGTGVDPNDIYFYFGSTQDSSQGTLCFNMGSDGLMYALLGYSLPLDTKMSWNADNFITTTTGTGAVWACAGDSTVIIDSNNNDTETKTFTVRKNSTISGSATTIFTILETGAITATADMTFADVSEGPVVKSPDGNRWRLSVDNAGVVSATDLDP